MAAEFRPTAQLAHLAERGVDFVVVGGIAATMHGSSRDTFDLDICPAQDPENLEALGSVLQELGARLRGVEEDVPFVAGARALRGMQILTLDTDLGPLDILMRPHGSPPYSRLRSRAQRVNMGQANVLIASIDDLLEMKRSADRKKDQALSLIHI